MPTLYTSKTGDDSDGLTLAKGFNTLEKAVLASANDGTILMDDGTYDCEDNAVTKTWHNIAGSTGLTIEAINEYQVTLVSTNANISRCVYVQATGSGVTFGKIIMDGTDRNTNVIDEAASVTAITFDGTYVRNGVSSGVLLNSTDAITFKNGWDVSGNMTGFGIWCVPPSGATTVDIYNGTVTMPAMTASSAGGIRVTPQATGVTANVYDIAFTMGIGSGTNFSPAIECFGVTTLDIHGITGTNSGADGDSVGGISVPNNAILCTSLTIYDIDISLGSVTSGTTEANGIQVGDNVDPGADANKISNVNVYDYTLTGCNHGLLFGWITGAKTYNGKIVNADLGVVLKVTTSCRAEGVEVINPAGKGLYDKGGTTDFFGNNTVISNTGIAPDGFLYQGPDSTTQSTGCTFANNNCYSSVEVVKWVVGLATVSTDTYNNNNFYSTVALPAQAWIRNSTPYATLALWTASAVTAADNVEVDPLFTDSANSDYSLTIASTLNATGVKWWGNVVPPVGYGGEPFPAFDIDIGAVQGIDATNHPFAPPNL